MAKINRVSRPLTDIHGNDFVTWQKIEKQEMSERVKKHFENSKKQRQEKVKNAKDWMVHVAGLGLVSIK